MTKREFIAQFVIAYIRSGQSSQSIVAIAEKRWNEIVNITPEENENA